MSWLKKLLPNAIRAEYQEKKGIPEGVWVKCEDCESVLYRTELERNLFICPKCHYHAYLPARMRLKLFLDDNTGTEHGGDILPSDKLKFKDSKKYKDRLLSAQEISREQEALIVMQGELKSMPVMVAAFEFNFMAGSMGVAVGKRFTLGAEMALAKRLPYICFSASGGARMQEAFFSLMQMAKTSAVLAKLAEKNLPFISVLTHPTMGGVTASLAMLGDIIIAEPRALIGLAGPRVIEQTVRATLPEGFQRSEFLLKHGIIDKIVDRREIRDVIARIIAKFTHYQAVRINES